MNFTAFTAMKKISYVFVVFAFLGSAAAFAADSISSVQGKSYGYSFCGDWGRNHHRR